MSPSEPERKKKLYARLRKARRKYGRILGIHPDDFLDYEFEVFVIVFEALMQEMMLTMRGEGGDAVQRELTNDQASRAASLMSDEVLEHFVKMFSDPDTRIGMMKMAYEKHGMDQAQIVNQNSEELLAEAKRHLEMRSIFKGIDDELKEDDEDGDGG